MLYYLYIYIEKCETAINYYSLFNHKNSANKIKNIFQNHYSTLLNDLIITQYNIKLDEN